jgi:tetratricopeptide (TPR) repeat protein
MKIKFLITGVLSLVTVAAFAQKGELKNADDKFASYDATHTTKVFASKAESDLMDAKTSIDKASTNDKTANLTQTYALKGVIYSALVLDSTQKATQAANYKTASDALAKAKTLDSGKDEYKKLITEGSSNLSQYQYNVGVAAYQSQKYMDAYNAFLAFKQFRAPDDTIAPYVLGLSAGQVGRTDPKYNQIAITSDKMLLASATFNRKQETYSNVIGLYMAAKDTADAFKTAMEAVQKYPASDVLRNQAIVLGLQSGKQDQVINTIDEAVKANPNDKNLYYYEGLTYSQIADNYNKQFAKTKDAAAKSALETKITTNYLKASDSYTKALGIDPNFGDAALNNAYVNLKAVLVIYTDANELPTNQQKQYDAEMAKVKAQLEAIQPIMMKAADLNPTSTSALQNLKAFYLLKNDMADANATQKKIDALPKQ